MKCKHPNLAPAINYLIIGGINTEKIIIPSEC